MGIRNCCHQIQILKITPIFLKLIFIHLFFGYQRSLNFQNIVLSELMPPFLWNIFFNIQYFPKTMLILA